MIAPVDDIDRIMAVMDAAFDPAFGEAWTRRQVEDALLMGHCHYALIDSAGAIGGESFAPGAQPAGFSLVRAGFGEEELLLFGVSPAYRRRGFGRLLLEDMVSSARARGSEKIFLEMREGNPAGQLYSSFGFQPVGRRKAYYRSTAGDCLDAITFALAINQSDATV